MPDKAFEIHGPTRVLAEKHGRLEERWEGPWIKVNVHFRDRMLRELKGVPLSVFLCLALHMDEDNISHPSLDLISAETGYSIRAIQGALKMLAARGWVAVQSGKEAGTVNRYYLSKAVSFGDKPPHMGLELDANPTHTEVGTLQQSSKGVGSRAPRGLANRRRPSANEEEPKEEPLGRATEEESVPREIDHVSGSSPPRDKGEDHNNDFGLVVRTWEGCNGPITPLIAEELQVLAEECEEHRRKLPGGATGSDTHGMGWVIAAIKESAVSATNGRFNLNYLSRVLDRWMAEGFMSQRDDHKQREDTCPTCGEHFKFCRCEWGAKRRRLRYIGENSNG